MTRKCNFRCEYCYFPHDNTPVTQILPVDRIRAFLDATGREWTVGMTGGEPFIYPGFVDICAALTRHHRIGVDTNLSMSSRVREFARRIDPARVQDLYVALHIKERERVRGVAAFIDNARLLADSGFKVIVNYVVHPELETRFAADCEFFARHGIGITPRPFRGEHQGRRYPEAYGERAHAIFADHPEQGLKVAFNFMGVPCHAGRTLLRLDEDGTVYRCPGDKTVLGNVLGEVRLFDGPQPCVRPRCPCRGLDHVLLDAVGQRLVRGVQFAVVGDLDASEASFGQALDLAPGHPCAENNLGVIAFRRGDRAAAVERFAAAHSARSGKADYLDNLAMARGPGPDRDPKICLDVHPAAGK
ncbi:radical SAM protein [Pseudodesulfovibrio alkaliphilus]|nr:radical SAM protein [Pseudodesulfovibrio alkaliphilus]